MSSTQSMAVTQGVKVEVAPRYHPERSSPGTGYWFFSYTVRITNEGSRPVQLMTRHWIITDASGHEEHVRGPGVIGEQPLLTPGQSFEYTSFCPLPTSMGTMHGSYQMQVPEGLFDAVIAPFSLIDPLECN